MFHRILDVSSKIKSGTLHEVQQSSTDTEQRQLLSKGNDVAPSILTTHNKESTSPNSVLLGQGAMSWLTMFLSYTEKGILSVGKSDEFRAEWSFILN